jgi:hypothetical protein
MTSAQADSAIDTWLKQLVLHPVSSGLFDAWRQLVVQHDVKGKAAHDARLIAAMLDAGIAELLTFNIGDFARYSQVKVYTPEDILRGKLE